MKRKILYVITKANWGGAQRYVFDLATNLPKEEFEVSVAFGQRGKLAEKLEAEGVTTYDIKSLQRDVSFGADIKSFFELLRLFKKVRPDAVHLNSSKAGGVGALAARVAGVPKIVFTSHGLAWDEDRGWLACFLIYLMSRLTFILCHDVITISEDTHRRVPESTLIYNGIGPIEFLEREEARRILNLPPHQIVVGALGELTRNKGYQYLLDAITLLKTPAMFVIIGEGEERTSIEQQISEKSLPVRLAGFVPNAARLITAFDIFVMPSVKEGLPYVLLEAGNASMPVVASRIPGITDVLGDAGLLFETKNPIALAEELETLLTSPELRQTLGKKLKERVSKEFSLQQMVYNTETLYAS